MRILFTKTISKEFLTSKLNKEIAFDIIPFLEIKHIPVNSFQNQIEPSFPNYLISSQNAVESIKNLKLDGEFYVVGKNTAKLLQKYGFHVKQVKKYASELADSIIENSVTTGWNFFCGNNRRETLVAKLSKNGHKINEILVYHSEIKPVKLNSINFDAVAFFSPLGVRSFFKNNTVSDETAIFTIGETTADEVGNYVQNKTLTPSEPTINEMISMINKFFHDKK